MFLRKTLLRQQVSLLRLGSVCQLPCISTVCTSHHWIPFIQHRYLCFSLRNDMDSMQVTTEMLDNLKQRELDRAAKVGDVHKLIDILASQTQFSTPIYLRIMRTLQHQKLWETALQIVDYAIQADLMDKGNWMFTIDVMLESPLFRDTSVLIQLMAKQNYKPADIHVQRLVTQLKEADLLSEILVLVDTLNTCRYPPSQDVIH